MSEHYPDRLVVFKPKEVKKEEPSESKEAKDFTGTNFSATTAMNPIQQTTTGMAPSYPDKGYVKVLNRLIEARNRDETINNGFETEQLAIRVL